MRVFQARLFLSYSHDDEEAALALQAELERRGFEAFVDREGLLVGENFVGRLQVELARADAVVALLTPSFAASEWCQAELHHAHAKGILVLPVTLGAVPVNLPEPLRMLQEQIHAIGVGKEGEPARLGARLGEQLHRLRRRRRWRDLRRWLLAVLGLVLLVWAGIAVFRSLEAIQDALAREAQLRRLEGLAEPLQEQEIARVVGEFSGDRRLAGRLHSLARDSTQSAATRLTALVVGSRIVVPGDPRDRLVIEDLEWRDAVIEDLRLINVTFTRGMHSGIEFRRGTLSGVVWNEAPAIGREGLTVANTLFDDVSFHACWFAGPSLVGVEFRNSVFRGCVLDVSGFSRVRVETVSSVPEGSNLITDELALFENSVVVNRNSPPDPGVLDLGYPKDEVVFRGVAFDSVHFRGWIRPEWFENCWFRNSVVPGSLDREALEAGGNRLEDVLWADEAVD